MPADVNRDDLDAYVDGQLDPWQRMAVEGWLALHPAEAARVMDELRLKAELKLALGLPGGRVGDGQRAKELGRALAPRWFGLGVPAMAAAASIFALWIAFGPVGVREGFAAPPPPPFVESALAAREASLLRLSMASQPEAEFDPVEIRALTGLVAPGIPDEWVPRDAQIFPSPQGPGLEMIFDTPHQGRMSLFLVRTAGADGFGSTSFEDLNLAWFIDGGIAHVLGSHAPADTLIAAADLLRSSR